MVRHPWTLVFPCLLSGACSVASPVVKARAAHDFGCPEQQVTVTELAQSQYFAKGCGKEAEYVCAKEKSSPVCSRDSAIRAAK